MQRFLLTALVSLASLTVLPMAVMAQEEENDIIFSVEETGTGRTLQEVLDAIRVHIPRPSTMPATVALPAKAAREWQTEARRLREQQLTHRRGCVEAIRRANRDTIVADASSCVRSDLLQEIALLQKQQAYLETIPLRNGAVRAGLRDDLAAMTDAVTAIVNAIDAGFFRQIDSLRQATRNLHVQYRQPLSRRVTEVRLERERTWVLHVANALEKREIADAPTAALFLPPALCLEESSLLLAADDDDPATAHRAVRSLLSRCKQALQEAIAEASAEEEPLE